MTSTYKKEFNDLIKDNKIHRFVTQLQYCNDPIEIKKIKNILSDLQTICEDTSNESTMKKYLEKIDLYQYRKQWHRLKPFQQEDRLINFIETEKISKKIAKQLFKMHENKEFKNKTVKYDPTEGKLLSINKLVKNDDGEYELKNT